MLGDAAQSHRRINDEVIDVAITVEVHRQRVSMGMVVAEWLAVFVPASQFGAMNGITLGQATNDGAMKQFRLWERACTGGQRRSVAARSGEREQHGSHRHRRSCFAGRGHAYLEGIGSPPVQPSLRPRRLRPAMLLPPRRVFCEARQQIRWVWSNCLFSFLQQFRGRLLFSPRAWETPQELFPSPRGATRYISLRRSAPSMTSARSPSQGDRLPGAERR